MSRYSNIHLVGVRPPATALDAQSWRDLEPATKGGSHFGVANENAKPFRIHCANHLEQVLRTLIARPLYCGSRCRHSQYVAELREMGVDIETEGFRADDKSVREIYGVYFLRSQVRLFDMSELVK